MDRILLIVFGTLSFPGLFFGALAVYMAVRAAKKKDAELSMAMWSVAAIAGLAIGGMSLAYFVIPIVLVHLQAH